MPRAGLLEHTGLKVTQRATRAVSEAVFYAIGISGVTEEEMCPEKQNSHLKRWLVCQEYHKEVCVEAEGAHSIGTDIPKGCW